MPFSGALWLLLQQTITGSDIQLAESWLDEFSQDFVTCMEVLLIFKLMYDFNYFAERHCNMNVRTHG